MSKIEIIVAGFLFFSLAIIAFIITIIEFIKMDKNPENYKNPRYEKKRKSSPQKKKAIQTKKRITRSKKKPA